MNIKVEGSSYECELSRNYIFDIWRSSKGGIAEKLRDVFNVIQNYIENHGYTFDHPQVRTLLRTRISELWKKCHRNKYQLDRKHSSWFSKVEKISLFSPATESSPNLSSTSPPRIKLRRIQDLTELSEESAGDGLHSAVLQEKPSILPAKPSSVIDLITEADLTKHQYTLIRSFINTAIDVDFLPCYDSFFKEETKSQPNDTISITDSTDEEELLES